VPAVTTAIGINGGHCAGIHLNMPLGQPDNADNPTAERDALAAAVHYDKWDSGYASSRPPVRRRSDTD
jgi:hypothetical protein